MKLAYMVKPKLLYRGSLSSHGKCPEKHKCCCLAFFYLRNCHLRRTVWKMQTMDHKLIQGPELEKPFRILLAFSGLRQALTTNPGYNLRVAECQEAAKVLLTYAQIYLIHTFCIIDFFILHLCLWYSFLCIKIFSWFYFLFSASGNSELEPTLCNGKNTFEFGFISLIRYMLIRFFLLPSLYRATEQLSMRSMKLTR